MQTLLLAARLSVYICNFFLMLGLSSPPSIFMPMPGSSVSPSIFVLFISRLSALASASISIMSMFVPRSVFLSMAAVFMPIPKLFALFSAFVMSIPVPESTFLSAFTIYVLMSGSSTLLSVFAISMPVPRLFSFPSASIMLVPMLGSSALSFPIWSFLQTLTPVPRRQKLGQRSEIIKKAFSEEFPLIFASLFLSKNTCLPSSYHLMVLSKNSHLIKPLPLTISY